MRLVLFTDLDGTLLDHEDYSYKAAEPALTRLQQHDVPVVMVTSKTRAEVEQLRARLGNEDPFITENGGGVFFPRVCGPVESADAVQVNGYSTVILGRPYTEARSFIEARLSRFAIEGFGDMSQQRIAELTGLTPDEARLAARREFTEPFLLEPKSHLERLEIEAAEEGFAITTGGRFFHLIGERQDKGRAVELVAQFYRGKFEAEISTVGLGDSANDLSMLRVVDLPVVIPRVSGERLELSDRKPTVASQPGSRGWNEAVMAILARVYSGDS